MKRWHRHDAKTGKAEGHQCFECTEATGQGYPELSWEQLLIKIKVNKSFGKEVSNVIKRWRHAHAKGNEQQKSGRPSRLQHATQDLDAERLEGYTLERIMMFIAEAELLAEHSIAMKDVPELKPHIQGLTEENGKPIRGIAVQDPAHPHRLLRVFSSFQSMLSERIHAGQIARHWQHRAEAQEEVVEERDSRPPSPPRQSWHEEDVEMKEQKGEEVGHQQGFVSFVSTLSGRLAAKSAGKPPKKRKTQSPQPELRRRVAGKRAASVTRPLVGSQGLDEAAKSSASHVRGIRWWQQTEGVEGCDASKQGVGSRSILRCPYGCCLLRSLAQASSEHESPDVFEQVNTLPRKAMFSAQAK